MADDGCDMQDRLHMTSREYRPEIDGLRALAVLPVVFFHLGFEWIRGGFLGVDVFSLFQAS
jgi:peptidoglycan/LPS O-acetylase OafA/YrhL